MIQGVRRREEADGLDLSPRLVVRLGALLKHRLAVTRAAIDAGRAGSPIENFLLSDALLREAPDLRADRFAELAATIEPGLSLQGPDADGWRVIALREEILAEEGWQEAEEHAEAAGASSPAPSDDRIALMPSGGSARGLKPLLSEEERRRFLGPQKLSEARFRLLISGKAEDKAEALRIIAFGPLSEEDKIRFLARGLVDGEASVRREAGELLAGLGLHADVVAVVRELAMGMRGTEYSLERLARVAASLREREREVALLVLATALRDEERGSVKAGIIRALEAFAGFADEGLLRTVLPAVSRALAADFRAVADACAGLLAAWRERNPEICERLFLDEFALAASPDAALLYAGILAHADLTEDGRRALAGALAGGIEGERYRGDRLWRAGDALACLGAPAFEAIRSIFPRMDGPARVFLVGVLDRLVREGPPEDETRVRVVEFFLEILRAEERPVRIAVFESSLLARERFPAAVESAIARQFLENLRHCGSGTNFRNVEAAFIAFGRGAIEPLREFIRDGLDYAGKDWAVQMLGQVIASLPVERPGGAEPAVDDAIRFLRPYYTLPYVSNGVLAIALGEMCRSPGATPSLVEEVVEEFFSKIGRVPYVADLIDALRRAALGPSLGAPLRGRIVDWLLACVRRDVPRDGVTVETDPAGRLVFRADPRTDLLTEMIPRAVRGLAEIAVSGTVSPEDRDRIVDELIARRQLTLRGDIHWGPYNEEVLVRALLRIAEGEAVGDDDVARILEALEGQLYRGAIARAIGEILRVRPTSQRLGIVAARFIIPLARQVVQSTRGRPQSGLSAGDFCAALASLAGRPALGRTQEEGAHLRQAVVAILLDRARGDSQEAASALRDLAGAPGLPEDLRRRIRSRIEGLGSLGHLPG
ncbi:MAG: hypothetical protein JXP34_26555 [Planctomycetes bacterium]|nr:hypothetical protein [Planctomycetota bacterium]